jgi:NAD-dependent deacetylase
MRIYRRYYDYIGRSVCTHDSSFDSTRRALHDAGMAVSPEEALGRAAELVAAASYVTALVGAGISVESGIRPYRGKGGLWTEKGEPPMNGFQRFLADPARYWRARTERMAEPESLAIRVAQPNAAHLALADLEREGVMQHVISQNIDNLHRAAGQRSLTEIHGNYQWVRCIDCHRRWPQAEYAPEQMPPLCDRCGGLVKSDVVDFGEPIPPDAIRGSNDAANRTDCMLLVGTTGLVYPAAGFAIQAHRRGAALIEVNPDLTALSEYCEVRLEGPAGEMLPALLERVLALRDTGSVRRRP